MGLFDDIEIPEQAAPPTGGLFDDIDVPQIERQSGDLFGDIDIAEPEPVDRSDEPILATVPRISKPKKEGGFLDSARQFFGGDKVSDQSLSDLITGGTPEAPPPPTIDEQVAGGESQAEFQRQLAKRRAEAVRNDPNATAEDKAAAQAGIRGALETGLAAGEAGVAAADVEGTRALAAGTAAAASGVTFGLSDLAMKQIADATGTDRAQLEGNPERIMGGITTMLAGVLTGKAVFGAAGKRFGGKGIAGTLVLRTALGGATSALRNATQVGTGDKDFSEAARDTAIDTVLSAVSVVPEAAIPSGLKNFVGQVATGIVGDFVADTVFTKRFQEQGAKEWLLNEIPRIAMDAVFAGADITDPSNANRMNAQLKRAVRDGVNGVKSRFKVAGRNEFVDPKQKGFIDESGEKVDIASVMREVSTELKGEPSPVDILSPARERAEPSTRGTTDDIAEAERERGGRARADAASGRDLQTLLGRTGSLQADGTVDPVTTRRIGEPAEPISDEQRLAQVKQIDDARAEGLPSFRAEDTDPTQRAEIPEDSAPKRMDVAEAETQNPEVRASVNAATRVVTEADARLGTQDDTTSRVPRQDTANDIPDRPARAVAGATKPRRFTQQVLDDPTVDQDVKNAIQDPDYIPISNLKSSAEASAVIESKGTDASEALILDRRNELSLVTRNMMGQQLIRARNEQGRIARAEGNEADAASSYDRAAEMVDTVASMGTSAGQGIQALATWGSMTSESMQRMATKAKRSLVEKTKRPKTGLSKDEEARLTPDEASRIDEFTKAIEDAPEGFQKNEKIIDMLTYVDKLGGGATRLDIGVSLWYANILSGHRTQQRNIIDTAANSIADVFINAAINRENPLKALGIMINGLSTRGRATAGRTLTTGIGRDEGQKFEQKTGTLKGRSALESTKFTGLARPLNAWKFVARAMQAEDDIWFKGTQEARSWILARRMAKETGLKGKALSVEVERILGTSEQDIARFTVQAESEGLVGAQKKLRVFELTEQARPPEIMEDSTAFAGRATYNYDPEGILGTAARAVSNMARAHPGIKLIVPFTRIVANVTNRGIQYTPLGYKRAFGKKITPREKELRAENIAKSTVGSLAMAAAYAADAMSDDDGFKIYGGGPRDHEKRNQLRETGWRPWSVKIGEKYYDYRLSPVNIAFAIVGNMRDAERFDNMDEESMKTKLTASVLMTGDVVLNQSFLSGVGDMFEMFSAAKSNPKRAQAVADNFLSRTAGGFLAPNLIRQIEQIWNKDIEENRNLTEAMLRQIPFARNAVDDKINALGEKAQYKGGLVISGKGSDPVWNMLAEKDAKIPMPSRTQSKIDNRTMTPEEHHDYVKISGQLLKKRIEENMETLQAMEPEELQAWISDNTRASNKDSVRYRAKAEMLGIQLPRARRTRKTSSRPSRTRRERL